MGGLDDIDQCIRTILATPKGSDPLRPDFGSDHYRYVDWPQNTVAPHLVREAVVAVATWEPRVVEVSVTVTHGIGAVEFFVRWRPVLSADEFRTTVVRLAS